METSRKQFVFAVVGSSIWMNLSEFVRNEVLLKQKWLDGFGDIGLIFPSEPINGAIWGLWAVIFATFLTWLVRKLDILQSVFISWVLGFVLLWIAMWNMGVLPKGILIWAIPWSFFEVFVAALIIKKIISNKA